MLGQLDVKVIAVIGEFVNSGEKIYFTISLNIKTDELLENSNYDIKLIKLKDIFYALALFKEKIILLNVNSLNDMSVEEIIDIIIHESLHIDLFHIEGVESSDCLDNIVDDDYIF